MTTTSKAAVEGAVGATGVDMRGAPVDGLRRAAR
jgi:hypothetical protein